MAFEDGCYQLVITSLLHLPVLREADVSGSFFLLSLTCTNIKWCKLYNGPLHNTIRYIVPQSVLLACYYNVRSRKVRDVVVSDKF